MRIRIDTHTFIWYIADRKRLSRMAVNLIESDET